MGQLWVQPKSPISPRWSGRLGWLEGSLCSRGSGRSLTLFWRLALSTDRKRSTAPAWRQRNPDIAVFCRCLFGNTLPRKWSGTYSIKIQPRPWRETSSACFFSAPAALLFSPHQWKALLKIGKGNTLCICTVLAFEAFCPAGKLCAHRSAKPWMYDIITVSSVFSPFLFLVKGSSHPSSLLKKTEAGKNRKQLPFKFSFYVRSGNIYK